MKQLIKKILKEENLKSELSGIIKFIKSIKLLIKFYHQIGLIIGKIRKLATL